MQLFTISIILNLVSSLLTTQAWSSVGYPCNQTKSGLAEEKVAQKEFYCQAARQANEAEGAQSSLIIAWSLVTSVCVVSCVSTKTAEGLCFGVAAGAIATDVALSIMSNKKLMNALGTMVGALGMGLGMTMLDSEDGCAQAAIAALVTMQKVMSTSGFRKTKESSLASAKIIHESTIVVPIPSPSPSVTPIVDGANSYSRLSLQKDQLIMSQAAPNPIDREELVRIGNCNQYRDINKGASFLQCVTQNDPKLSKFFKNPQMYSIFQKNAGMSIDQWIKIIPPNATPAELVASSYLKTGNALKMKPLLTRAFYEIQTELDEVNRKLANSQQMGQPSSSAATQSMAKKTEARNPTSSLSNATNDHGLGPDPQATPANLALSNEVPQTERQYPTLNPTFTPGSFDSARIPAEVRDPEEIANNMSINIFKRISERYNSFAVRIEEKPVAAPF